VVLDNQLSEPVEVVVTLSFGHFVDTFCVVSDGIHALPACDRVGPDHRMNNLEVCSDILWSAAFGTVQLEVVLLGALIEDRLCIGGCQSFQEFLVCRRQAVVDLVARRPQSVSASLGELGEPQDGVVTRYRLKGNVTVPAFLVALPFVTPEALGVQLFGLFGANDGDLIILATKCSAAVGDGMDVQLRSGWLA
jgi:hypothetical protein